MQGLTPFRLTFVLFLLVFIIGCSGSENTLQPEIGTPPTLNADLHQEPFTNPHSLLAFYNIYADPVSGEYDLVPLREAMGHWNVLGKLEGGPCFDCVQVKNLNPMGNGVVKIDVEIRHPYVMPNFTVFDVRGIVMFKANKIYPVSGLTISDRGLGGGELLNADGYTTLYNFSTEGNGYEGFKGYIDGELSTVAQPTALLNAFKRHVSTNPDNNRNAFFSGDIVTVTYEIDLPDGQFVMGYAVDACWQPPDVKPVTNPLVDFGLDANCPEAWKINGYTSAI